MVARNGDHTYAKTDRVRYSPACAHISYLQPYYTSRTVLESACACTYTRRVYRVRVPVIAVYPVLRAVFAAERRLEKRKRTNPIHYFRCVSLK